MSGPIGRCFLVFTELYRRQRQSQVLLARTMESQAPSKVAPAGDCAT